MKTQILFAQKADFKDEEGDRKIFHKIAVLGKQCDGITDANGTTRHGRELVEFPVDAELYASVVKQTLPCHAVLELEVSSGRGYKGKPSVAGIEFSKAA